jgi:hypothetical protein
MRIDPHAQFTHSADAWDDYLIPDTAGRYFYEYLEWGLPTASVFSFPHDSPQHMLTDLVGP